MPLAVDIVANEIARAPNKLPQRGEQRAIVHAPHLGNALGDAFPGDGPQIFLLRTRGTVIAHKFFAAIDAPVCLLRIVVGVINRVELPLLEVLIFLF